MLSADARVKLHLYEEDLMRPCDQEKNLKHCTCTYLSCSKRGLCCECVTYHRSMRELPGCFFPREVEKTYDRSIERFVKTFAHKG